MKSLELYYQCIVREGSDLVVLDTGIRAGHSFCKSFAQLMFNVEPFGCARFSPTTVTDTDGDSVTTTKTGGASRQMGFRTDASSTTSTYGIQVGTGTSAESINDTKLQTQISHGVAAGNLQYGTVSYGAPSTTATTTTFRTTRVFTNGSGGTVTVQEIGLVCRGNQSANNFLIIRDLTGAVAVTNGQQLTVNYDLTTTI